MAQLIVVREGEVTANMLNNKDIIVQIERDFDEPCDQEDYEDMPQWMIDLPDVPADTRTFNQVLADQEQARISGDTDAYYAHERTLANWQD